MALPSTYFCRPIRFLHIFPRTCAVSFHDFFFFLSFHLPAKIRGDTVFIYLFIFMCLC